MISQNTINKIKDMDIVEGISNYMDLRKAGENYVSCCPFHEESSPSFTVNRKRNKFNCFGCGERGDLIDFVMTFNRVSFHQACKDIAEKHGINVDTSEQSGYIPKSVKESLWEEKVILIMARGKKDISHSDKQRAILAKNRIDSIKKKYNLN